jgi:hypothetical protein
MVHYQVQTAGWVPVVAVQEQTNKQKERERERDEKCLQRGTDWVFK